MLTLHSISLVLLLCALTGAFGAVCPGGEWTCATGMTCCMLPSGHEGCCPYSNATCCPDKVHCCPMGSTCSAKGGGHCQSELDTIVAKQEKVAKLSPEKSYTSVSNAANDVCRDGARCPASATCCLTKSGSYGCCPLTNAVCCSDQLHCCPQGTTCNPAGYCLKEQVKLDIMNYTNSTLSGISTECPGGGSECPDDSTCCSLGSGDWGCCPLPKAACCPDQQHCCPNGYKCVGAEGCAKK